jgi:pilus assembly protein CpaB
VSIRTVLVVMLAIICGLAAAVGMNQLRRPGGTSTTPVAVAAVNVARGGMLGSKQIQIRDWPTEMVPNGALLSVEDATGRSAALPFLAGEVILEGKLAPKDAGRGLASLVPKGMRAYTIQSTRAASNVAGFILPGNKVDVLLTLKGSPQDDTGGGTTTTLLQSVEILAVDQQLDAPAENRNNLKELSSITLLVTPDQATLLDLGQNTGQLTLALRNADDSEESDRSATTLSQVRYPQGRPVADLKAARVGATDPAQTREFCEIVTLRGLQRGRILVTQ